MNLCEAEGFTVITTVEARKRGSSDSNQFAYAAEKKLTFVTHNRVHFEALARQYFLEGATHAGLIIAARRPANVLASRLLALLNDVSASEMENQVRYI